MARETANIRLSMWADRDWRNLSRGAQHLYMYLLSSPSLSYAGVTDWRPKRIVALSQGWTIEELEADRKELECGYFIFVDEDTDEAFIRSFIKHDGLLKHPKLPHSMANAFADISSNDIQDFFVFELQKIRNAQPELKCWDNPKVAEILGFEARDMKESRHGPCHSEAIDDQWAMANERASSSHTLDMNTATATATATPPKGGGGRPSGRKRPSTPIPDGWEPTEAHLERAREYRVNIDVEAEKFRNDAIAKDKRFVNWNSAFSNWLIIAKRFQDEKTPANSGWAIEGPY